MKALLNLSNYTDYISILLSNSSEKDIILPMDYVNYDVLAGVGKIDLLISNNDSFKKLNFFHEQKKDWLFGSFSYDLKRETEDLFSSNLDNFNADNLSFFVPEYVLLLNNNKLEVQTYYSKDECDDFLRAFDFSELKKSKLKAILSRRDSKQDYLEKIKEIKKYLKRGDIYEMNYCQEFYAIEKRFPPESIFLELNEKMKAPFSAFLKLNDKYILSASPERFLRKKGSYILSQPIKGTRKRGRTTFEDASLINALNLSQKDTSENIMIADLVRNDLSITAKKNSVKIEELCKVYSFEKVHQMITSIISEIDSDISFTDVLMNTFPMGSMTGAPKIRAMELIEYFEEFQRGFFSGAVGYITPEADFDFNVVIRTILYNLANNYLSIGVGGAITIKSNPIQEYEECLIKVKPIFDILNFQVDD